MLSIDFISSNKIFFYFIMNFYLKKQNKRIRKTYRNKNNNRKKILKNINNNNLYLK